VPVTVRDNPEKSRYEVYADDDLAGFTAYHRFRDEIAFLHTETTPAFGGRGLAGQLVRNALDDARRRGLAVLPFCPYVRGFIIRHPEYLDLVPQCQRDRFGLGPPAS
jgi:predicted GNAT family acetyltransferase